MGLLEPQVDTIFCSVVQDAAWVMCLPRVAATGFTGLSFLEGPLKDCIKFQNPNK